MLDINFIRNHTDLVKNGMKNKGEKDLSAVDRVLMADEKWRERVTRLEQLRAENNTQAKKIGQLMGEGKKEEAQVLIEETSDNKGIIKELEKEIDRLHEDRENLLLRIPNVPHESVPVGKMEEDNVVFSTWNQPDPEHADEWQKPHWELAEVNGWIDFERGAKVTGAGFPFYHGSLARLQRALINFFLDEGLSNGYREIQAPYFVNEISARGTGNIPDKEDMMYVIPRDGFYAIPTAEVPVTNFHRDEILSAEELPVKYVAYTPCWRREAGSYGKDVRGLNRLHQFDKVELVKIVESDTSYDELESLREDAESLLKKLELPYRTLLMCTGDMGFTQSKKYDLEVWSAGQKRWLEVSSCSNFTDFQARRMQMRYRDENDRIHIAHTLNGSGLALPRVVAAILEAYQMKNGNIAVPAVLHPYMNSEYL